MKSTTSRSRLVRSHPGVGRGCDLVGTLARLGWDAGAGRPMGRVQARFGQGDRVQLGRRAGVAGSRDDAA